jgi:hypothetical protein
MSYGFGSVYIFLSSLHLSPGLLSLFPKHNGTHHFLKALKFQEASGTVGLSPGSRPLLLSKQLCFDLFYTEIPLKIWLKRGFCYTKQKQKGCRVAQVIEYLPSKDEVLSSNPGTTKKKKKEKSSRKTNLCWLFRFRIFFHIPIILETYFSEVKSNHVMSKFKTFPRATIAYGV